MSESPLVTLARWEAAGAHWRVQRMTSGEADVQLLSCLGEAVDRLRSSDPELLNYLTGRASSDHPPARGEEDEQGSVD